MESQGADEGAPDGVGFVEGKRGEDAKWSYNENTTWDFSQSRLSSGY